MLQRLRDLMSPQQRRVVGEEARQLLQNKHFKDAWTALDVYLTGQEIGCDPDNKDKAQRLILSRQLLVEFRREFERKVEDGEMAKIEIQRIEEAGKPRKFFR